MPDNRTLITKYAPLFIILLGLVIYANSLPNQMFWDDENFILQNRHIQNWHFLPRLFAENVVAGSGHISNYWRPLLLTIFSLEWHLWKDTVFGWHLVNTCFHILSAVTLFLLLKRLTAKTILSLGVSLFFLAHPLQTEAVVYVNSLGDPLSTFFIFLGLLFFVRSQQESSTKDFGWAIMMFPLALMSKETGIVLCALIPLTDFLLLAQKASLLGRTKEVVRRAWPFATMAVGYIALRASVLNFDHTFNFYSVSNTFTQSIWVRVLTFFKAMSSYISLILAPIGLHVERTLLPVPSSLFSDGVLTGALYCAILILIIFKTWRKRPLLAFGAGWFFIGLAPVSNILVPINAMIYEHWLYLPLVGIVLIVCALGKTIMALYPNATRPLLVLSTMVLCVFSVLSIQRNLDWRTAEGFYEKTLQHVPNSYRVLNNLAVIYVQRGETAKAQAFYEKAIAANPLEPAAYNNLGWLFFNRKDFDQARSLFEKAHELDRKYLLPYEPLIYIYRQEHNESLALELEKQYSRPNN